jgi:hypothetical protein
VTVAGWAFDWSPLADMATRSVQGDFALLLLALGAVGLLFTGLSLVGGWMDRRAWRRDIARAHQPRPYDRERETA